MKNKGKKVLSAKIAMVFGAAMSTLSGANSSELIDEKLSANNNSIIVSDAKSTKPMPVMKLNFHNPSDSKFVASHASHRSHRSHRSHSSHWSGAMFS
jgi:hypothetical protein